MSNTRDWLTKIYILAVFFGIPITLASVTREQKINVDHLIPFIGEKVFQFITATFFLFVAMVAAKKSKKDQGTEFMQSLLAGAFAVASFILATLLLYISLVEPILMFWE